MNERMDGAVYSWYFSCLQKMGLKVSVLLKLTGYHSHTVVVVAAYCRVSLICLGGGKAMNC